MFASDFYDSDRRGQKLDEMDPAGVREMSASQLLGSQDTQLLQAIQMLGGSLAH